MHIHVHAHTQTPKTVCASASGPIACRGPACAVTPKFKVSQPDLSRSRSRSLARVLPRRASTAGRRPAARVRLHSCPSKLGTECPSKLGTERCRDGPRARIMARRAGPCCWRAGRCRACASAGQGETRKGPRLKGEGGCQEKAFSGVSGLWSWGVRPPR